MKADRQRASGRMRDSKKKAARPTNATSSAAALIATGSYSAREQIFDLMVVTDLDSYRLDIREGTLSSSAGSHGIEEEEANCSRVISDFICAVRERRSPRVSGRSVLPAMRVLEHAQRAWDAEHGARSIPGRPLHGRVGTS